MRARKTIKTSKVLDIKDRVSHSKEKEPLCFYIKKDNKLAGNQLVIKGFFTICSG